MSRLVTFLTSWPVVVPVVAGLAVVTVWPSEAYQVVRTFWLVQFLLAYFG